MIAKVREELAEIEGEIVQNHAEGIDEETGDMLIFVANVACKLKIEGETALQRATEKFDARFKVV